MKKILPLILFLITGKLVFADHIVGGEVYYSYLGPGSQPNRSKYSVSLRLFRDCNQPCGGNTGTACLPFAVTLGVFTNNSPYTRVVDLAVNRTNFKTITLTTYPDCISNKPPVCYEVATYTKTVELNNNTYGYRIAFQTCCRTPSENVLSDAGTMDGDPGATYECVLPGSNQLPSGNNSSAVFNLKDTALVCFESPFTLDFGATDADGDSLSYEFSAAYDGGDFLNAQDNPPGPPLYNSVHYNTSGGFSAFQPLGLNVSIDETTGIISGIAPGIGKYVVCVNVTEWRNGVVVGMHRKDFILLVSNCAIPQAGLKPSYITCDGYNLSFRNETESPIIKSFFWDFGVSEINTDTSVLEAPTYTFPDTGVYNIMLITNKGQQCSDTAVTVARVFPGFIPDFKIDGSCILNPYQFIDQTTSKYGQVFDWHWDFGETSVTGDTSNEQNPFYLYPTLGTKEIRLIVSNTKGCTDTVSKALEVNEKPLITLPFNDTLICSNDTLQLLASGGTGTALYSWSPSYNIINQNTANPYVFPKDTSSYIVTIDDKGCTNSDTVTVNVIDKVFVSLGADSTICQTDSFQLNPQSNGLYYLWSPPLTLSDANIKNPYAQPLSNTTYSVTATVGKCNATDYITIRVVPYPQANAGLDTNICFGKTTILQGNIVGSSFNWSPSASLLNSNTLTPAAGPQATTAYVLSVYDTLGCPKPFSDTVVVNVIPPVQAFAGNDTIIVVGQPLQLNASGGIIYTWSPSTGMNDSNIPNPVVTIGSSIDTITYRVRVSTPEGCDGYDDITVFIFETKPEIFVPTAFTPNGDGRNDILKPIVAGLKQFRFFRVFNRWGQMLYSTSEIGKGWDGTYSGEQQASGTYVFETQGIDYLGNSLVRKGTVVLIR